MANLITLARFPVLVGVVLLLYADSPALRLVAVGLAAVLIALDTVDGIVARARREVSLLGSVLDVMADRAVELVMWIVYADLRLVTVAIPIIFTLRGTIVDSLRSMSVRSGKAPLKTVHNRLGDWLVSSPFMRTTYGASKFASFVGLALTQTLAAYAARGALSDTSVRMSHSIFTFTSWIAVSLCLLRGLPVILDSLSALQRADGQSRGAGQHL